MKTYTTTTRGITPAQAYNIMLDMRGDEEIQIVSHLNKLNIWNLDKIEGTEKVRLHMTDGIGFSIIHVPKDEVRIERGYMCFGDLMLNIEQDD